MRNILTRRKIEIDEYNIPILDKYEADLYHNTDDSGRSLPFCQNTPFRSNTIFDEFFTDTDNESQLQIVAKLKGFKREELHPINKFNLTGLRKDEAEILLKTNFERFNCLKAQDKRYKGIQYGIDYLHIDDVHHYIIKLELGNRLKFDNHPYNVVLNCIQDNRHAVLCAFVVDTRDNKNPKVKKIIGFNSWAEIVQSGCPVISLKKLLDDSRSGVDKIEVTSIAYGAQASDAPQAWESDGNCGIYTINALNAMVKLLTDKKSIAHKILLQGESPNLKFEFNGKEVFMNLLMAFLLFLDENISMTTIHKGCVKWFALCALLSTLIPSINDYIRSIVLLGGLLIVSQIIINAIKMIRLQCNPMKKELQEALPQYFDKNNGQLKLKNYRERADSHINDRWLIGNLYIKTKKRRWVK